MFFVLITLGASLPSWALRTVQTNVVLDQFDDYGRCAERGYPPELCDKALNHWVQRHTEFAWPAAQQILPRNREEALSFFSLALQSDPSHCASKDFHPLVLSALQGDLSAVSLVAAQTVAFETCFADFKSDLLHATAAAAGDSAFVQKNCMQLKKKHLLKTASRKKCPPKS